MGIALGMSMSLRSAEPLDDRQKFDTVADMVAFPESSLYDGILAFCVATQTTYTFNSALSIDETLGRWREFKSGGGSVVSKETENAIEEKEDGIFVEKSYSKSEIDDKVSKIDKINFAQKIINSDLDYCHVTVATKVTSISTGTIVPFSKVASINNMETNPTNNSILLKAGKTYRISCDLYIDGSMAQFAIFDLTNNKQISQPFIKVAANASYTCSNFATECIYKATNDCEIQVKILYVAAAATSGLVEDHGFLIAEEIGKDIVIDPVNYVNTNNGLEDCPVGHIMSFMGTTAPKHYLSCDGSIYNIIDYKELAEFIKKEFGSYNYFGGDGINTFAVPDLQGEFLRGTGTNRHTNQGSGADVGTHQDATTMPNITNNGSNIIVSNKFVSNNDSSDSSYENILYTTSGTLINAGDERGTSIGTRPTNTSVLYCIKYEPTYYMSLTQYRKEKVLWEGKATANGSIVLDDDYDNYTELVFVTSTDSTQEKYETSEAHYLVQNIEADIERNLILINYSDYYIDSHFSSANKKVFYMDAFCGTNLALLKIVGVKYNTAQNSGAEIVVEDVELTPEEEQEVMDYIFTESED